MRHWWLGGLAMLAALVAACDKGDEGPCGATACGVNQTCDRSSTVPFCKCVPAYAGPTCMSCARGYAMNQLGQCVEAPIDCASGSAVCGGSVRGTCVAGGAGGDRCECRPGYAGRACGECAAGYQDNDRNGICDATCAAMAATCLAPKTCSDATGRAVCSCPPNTTGAMCESCISGFVRAPDGMCVKSCTASSCGAHQTCDTTQAIPTCICQPGWGGTDCSTCAAGYVADGRGGCVAAPPPGTTFLAGGKASGGADVLVALDAATAKATVLRPMSLGNLQLTADPATKTLYAANGSGLVKLDDATGQLVNVSPPIAGASNVAFLGGALYTIPNQAPYLLKRVDPVSKIVTDVGPTMTLSNVMSLAAEPGGAGLIAARYTTGPTLHRVDPNGVDPMTNVVPSTMLGTIMWDGMRLAPSDTKVAVSPGPAGATYVLTRVGRTAAELVIEHCLKVAVGLGLSGYDATKFTAVEHPYNGIGVGMSKVVTSTLPSGKEVIAYASYGTRGSVSSRATLTIDTRNPESFVCLSTYEESVLLRITKDARFAGVAFSGQRPALWLEVEPGFPGVAMPLLHVFGSTSSNIDASVRAYAVSKVYTSAEWSTERRLPVYVSVWSGDPAAPTQLLEMDLATMKPKRILTFAGVELVPAFAPWM